MERDVVSALRARANDARELARTCGNERAAQNILSYAAELEREAEKLEEQEHRQSGPKTKPRTGPEGG